MIDVVIPVRNEQDTIYRILLTFAMHRGIREVIVSVDHDTHDRSIAYISRACNISSLNGRNNIRIIVHPVSGKGQVIRAALPYVRTSHVIFCDADYTGLRSDHIDQIIPNLEEMRIGVPEFPVEHDFFSGDDIAVERRAMSWCWVSGFRSLPMWLLSGISPPLHGYMMETQINIAAYRAGLPVRHEWLTGLTSPYRMTPQRLAELERDRQWGIQHKIPGVR